MSLRKTTVTIQRYSFAFCVLVLMPAGVVQTMRDPSDEHVIALVACAFWTAGMGALYRHAVAKWLEEDDRGSL